MVDGTSGWISWVRSATGCVSGGFCVEGSSADGSGVEDLGAKVSSADGLGAGSGLGSGGGDGEWSGVIGVVGIW